MSEVRTRRRRSVARSPALVDPADLPEDAAGRIELIAIRAPEDAVDDRPRSASAAADRDDGAPGELLTSAQTTSFLTALDGWFAVAIIGAVLLVVFIVGMAVTR